jgi:hypothetical protein
VEFPHGQPNRIWLVENGKYTYNCNYNDQGIAYGIPENALTEQIKIYPNPAREYFTAEYPEDIEKLVLVSLTGSRVRVLDALPGKQTIVGIENLAKGAYILLFYTSDGLAGSKKLIKK